MTNKAAVLPGDRYDRLTVLREVEPKVYAVKGRTHVNRARRFLCRCVCGSEGVHTLAALRKGEAKSCGCLHRQKSADLCRRHGGAYLPEYRIWHSMRVRCGNPKHSSYKNYGGRGIRVCEEWQNSFKAFYDHVGPRPSPKFTLDRIENDGNYEPGNVRWATREQQAQNMRPRSR